MTPTGLRNLSRLVTGAELLDWRLMWIGGTCGPRTRGEGVSHTGGGGGGRFF
jgi:hypothetical protein